MRHLLFIALFLTSTIGYSQLTSTNTQETTNKKTQRYVIGIGNSDATTFNSVLDYLESDAAVIIYAVCTAHNIIGFQVMTNTYKSYDTIRDNLINQFEGIILLRKNSTILTKDCSDEIIKQ